MIMDMTASKGKTFAAISETETYEFVGHHLLASYFDCDRNALLNKEKLMNTMKHAVIASGATLLGSSEHVFPEGGITMVMLLAESHASIHTYPEHSACFVDFFTCGHSCDGEKFDSLLQEYLKPKTTRKRVMIRQ